MSIIDSRLALWNSQILAIRGVALFIDVYMGLNLVVLQNGNRDEYF